VLTHDSTVTTSAESTTTTTSTTRTVTTETVTQTATTTLAPVMARAANMAAAAEDIIASVVESGTTANNVTSSTKNSQQLQAEQGLSTACSCKLVNPTSTITESYALPPVVSALCSCTYCRLTKSVHNCGLPNSGSSCRNRHKEDHGIYNCHRDSSKG
jgi:hypothetical protein